MTDNKKFKVKFSYLEIYNENIIDLLCDNEDRNSLLIAEDERKGVYIPDLSEYTISTYDEII